MGRVRFLSDWSHEQDSNIHSGEPLSIEYSEERLPSCRARRYGRDAWNITAGVRFHPNGIEDDTLVNSGLLTVDVPSDATKVELWFKNTDQTGCVAWDSRYGQNYWLDITPA